MVLLPRLFHKPIKTIISIRTYAKQQQQQLNHSSTTSQIGSGISNDIRRYEIHLICILSF